MRNKTLSNKLDIIYGNMNQHKIVYRYKLGHLLHCMVLIDIYSNHMVQNKLK